MKFLKRLKSSNFWVSMISAVVLILQAVFDIEIKTEYLNQIILGILGILVMSGIVSDGSSEEVTVNSSINVDELKENISNMLNQAVASIENNVSSTIQQMQGVEESGKTENNETLTEEVANETVEQQTVEQKPLENSQQIEETSQTNTNNENVL